MVGCYCENLLVSLNGTPPGIFEEGADLSSWKPNDKLDELSRVSLLARDAVGSWLVFMSNAFHKTQDCLQKKNSMAL